MNCCRESVEMAVPPGNRRGLEPRRTEQYVAGSDTRGRPEGRSYPWSQQASREISGLELPHHRIIIQVVGDSPADTVYFFQVFRKELNVSRFGVVQYLLCVAGPGDGAGLRLSNEPGERQLRQAYSISSCDRAQVVQGLLHSLVVICLKQPVSRPVISLGKFVVGTKFPRQ